ncbi:MAG: D-tyrosyl-tRNA(Tyr) deacylase [Alphaproteobacteria bacterium CG_4_10_14_0_8_um_filter_53_9]|nr:MAG: D-tyrosyl-tRNA(Tyr) deacylase [Alphaproteobacteria bacterium CG_4_10_14_0_8_um_filter_53_9]PJC36555.1 MAG: D-tyrosyl-tRNA(Tyr) deacylase [Candidatus Peregrinibacteria bacterium CG_4_9_14_0_2_um_filter_53_11]
MIALIQRVSEAEVAVGGETIGKVGSGFLILLGVTHSDTESEIEKLINKIVHLRIFEDSEGKMNLSLLDRGGEVLVISQFTLFADCKKGRRPSFTGAARPELAEPLYKKFIQRIREAGVEKVEEGRFGADMKVSLINDGPVTIVLDSAQF